MPFIGYHASQEQFSPRELLRLVRAAEQAGFGAAMTSDHFNPWNAQQGHSGFSWSWLGAAMQATHLPFGSLAIPGGWRYHPAVLAQTIATLCDMFPGRLPWIAAGSGEALNESIVARGWPGKEERNARLAAGVEMMRALWQGEVLSADNGPIPVKEAKLWDLPSPPPKVFVAAMTPETARWAAPWADGLLTTCQPPEQLKKMKAAIDGGGARKTCYLQMQLSWARDRQTARDNAFRYWKTNVFSSAISQEIASPELYEAMAEKVRPEDMDATALITDDLDELMTKIVEVADLGFEGIFLHNAGSNQAEFISAFSAAILPKLASKGFGTGTS